MSLKNVAIACAIASLILLIMSIGNYVIGYSYLSLLGQIPYWAFYICHAIFFFLFSKRM